MQKSVIESNKKIKYYVFIINNEEPNDCNLVFIYIKHYCIYPASLYVHKTVWWEVNKSGASAVILAVAQLRPISRKSKSIILK